MQAHEIETHLGELGDELERQGIEQPIRLLVIGGAFMLLEVRNRKNTDDIDVLFTGIENPPASPLYQAFKDAVHVVAVKKRLRGNWLNDLMAEILQDISRVPAGTLWRRYGKLEVFFPPKEYILALKLLAGRRKDRADVLALCQQLDIRTRAQAQAVVDRFIPDPEVQQLNHLERTLNTLERTLKRMFGA
jgi:hypothetical protein